MQKPTNTPTIPLLVPAPRQLALTGGVYTLTGPRLIILEGPNPQEMRFAAQRFLHKMQERLNLDWEILAGKNVPIGQTGLRLQISPQSGSQEQGYQLTITPDGITITARSGAGIFYGCCTLIQILEQSGNSLPCLQITDWPDFPVRGVMLDISRDKVPMLETLRSLVDMLAGWKINQLQLYTEHTFAYLRHPEVWKNASPIRGQEILDLDVFCRERFIELVPNQNSFGHMRRWLIHPTYQPLAEITGSFQVPWGIETGPYSLCPIDPGSLDLVRSLYDELLPHFTSRMVNVGCDETFDLGQGRSKEQCSQAGPGRVYLDYLLKIYQDLKERGFTMQFWGDIILSYPELIPELPKDMIALDWGYEGDHPFESHAAEFNAVGIPYYVCPGTSSWCSLAGRTDNALANLRNAAESGIRHGASGYLITDWGDNGHWQTLPISFLGLLAGAAYAWAFEANRDLNIPLALNQHAFRDRAGVMGQIAYDLGNVYRAVGLEPINTSVLFFLLQRPLSVLRTKDYLRPIPFENVLEAIEAAISPLASADMDRPDGALILREFELTARLMRHACQRGMLAVEAISGAYDTAYKAQQLATLERDLGAIIADYQEIWLARNRPGGLLDSVARFEKARQDYLDEAETPQVFAPVPAV